MVDIEWNGPLVSGADADAEEDTTKVVCHIVVSCRFCCILFFSQLLLLSSVALVTSYFIFIFIFIII